MTTSSRSHLHQLARLYGIQTAYYNMRQQRQATSPEALRAILQALGAPVGSAQDLPSALRERRQALWQRRLEPVVVHWEGSPPQVKIRLPAQSAELPVTGHLKTETGEEFHGQWSGGALPVLEAAEVEGTKYISKQLSLPELPPGYHRFALEIGGKSAEALIIIAPRKAYPLADSFGTRGWGVFLPLYALHHERNWGADFGALEELMAWVSGLGGTIVATLPLLAAFLDKPVSLSPYAPVSRLLWNEFYLDIAKVPELSKCLSAQSFLASASFQTDRAEMKQSAFVDYQRLMALKRRVLEALCHCCFSGDSGRLAELQRFAKDHPVIEDYARFRATMEKQGTTWRLWPPAPRGGLLSEHDFHEADRHYHLYVQWLADQQMETLADKARQTGAGLYLDLPLGVHPDGYDAWRWQNVFVNGVSVGAPPDVLFTRGQDWGFSPLHPERLREQGYDYFIACLRHHLRCARGLRIDHIMGFHRLFWIPRGIPASQGVYVRYPAEEFYAILALESHRHKTAIVGEDLGIVPHEVRPAMARHGIQRMCVVQFELESDPGRALRAVPAKAVATLNTHDMSPFAAFWQGRDIQMPSESGLCDAAKVREETTRRQTLKTALVSFLQQSGWLTARTASLRDVLRATLAALGASRAGAVLINLEDLWQEVALQNRPGTADDRNWRRKARYSFAVFSRLPEVVQALSEIDRVRKGESRIFAK